VGQDARYGRPLRVLGSAGLAPSTELGPQTDLKIPAGPGSPSSPSHNAALELNVVRGMHAAYPSLRLSDVLTPLGFTVIAGYLYECNAHLADVIEEMGIPNLPLSLVKFPFSPSWSGAVYANTQGQASTVAPVLVMQGTADTVVNPNATTAYVGLACRFQQPVQYSRYLGATHQTIPYVAQNEYVAWIGARFAGKRAPSNCS
jgi:hypothetical protein